VIIGVGMVSISIYAVDVGAAEVLGVMTRTVGFQSCLLVMPAGALVVYAAWTPSDS